MITERSMCMKHDRQQSLLYKETIQEKKHKKKTNYKKTENMKREFIEYKWLT